MADRTINDTIEGYAERWDKLLDHAEEVKDDLKALKEEIKGAGFNVKAMQRLVAIRRDKLVREGEQVVLNDLLLYANATGTPFNVTG